MDSAAVHPFIGISPEKGKSHEVRATTASGVPPRAYAAARRFVSHKAPATIPTNSPATGLAIVARAASSAVRRRAAGRYDHRRTTGESLPKTTIGAARPNMVPSPNDARPETALQVRPKAPYNAGHSGRCTAWLRTSNRARRAAETVPDTAKVVRTPSRLVTYGDRTL
ncbi:hypothetical protein [Streptomyces sp. AC602_WCS936]|uniref:hypothetical protein n=1 Tax=Streptomyces sp. AC602_WCS936 TaxID=2823685 RepID=UPI001C253691|nr:hypothetical protein [Streptomyces sp. AC602_WCS936]